MHDMISLQGENCDLNHNPLIRRNVTAPVSNNRNIAYLSDVISPLNFIYLLFYVYLSITSVYTRLLMMTVRSFATNIFVGFVFELTIIIHSHSNDIKIENRNRKKIKSINHHP